MGEIVLKNIEMTLNRDSIQSAINMIHDLQGNLADALAELARILTEDRGKRIAQMYIAQFPAIDTGALHDSINGEYIKSAHYGVVATGVMYAAFVEFGTGIVGEENPYPGDAGWAYDVNGHGEAGWYYYSDSGWHHIRGMPARPFMYNTLRELEAEAEAEGGRIIAQYIP